MERRLRLSAFQQTGDGHNNNISNNISNHDDDGDEDDDDDDIDDDVVQPTPAPSRHRPVSPSPMDTGPTTREASPDLLAPRSASSPAADRTVVVVAPAVSLIGGGGGGGGAGGGLAGAVPAVAARLAIRAAPGDLGTPNRRGDALIVPETPAYQMAIRPEAARRTNLDQDSPGLLSVCTR